MKTSLVTGGAGFIGSHVADTLLEMGHRVVVMDDLSGGFAQNVPERATFVEGSIMDQELIETLFTKYRFNYVYHLAAYAAEGLSHFIRRFNYMNNLVGSVNLINASVNHEVECFVFTSSIAVYGAGQSPMTEDMIPVPEDPYGIAKLAVEQDLRVAHEMFGLDSIVFRPHNVYGTRQNIGDRYRNVVGIFMNQCLRGEPLTIFGDGEQMRAFSDISDVAPVIAKSVDVKASHNQVFNIGADVPFTVNVLADVVSRAMGVSCKKVHLPPRNEVKVAYADHSKAHRIFQPKKFMDLEEGIRNMAAWVKVHGSRESNVFSAVEVPKNMPPTWAAVLRGAGVKA